MVLLAAARAGTCIMMGRPRTATQMACGLAATA